MSTSSVYLTADAYLVCLAHALSTEKEEIMGLLIGDIDHAHACHLSSVIMLTRSDKQPDRVEISPEQLSAASTEAEILGVELGRSMRVIGWYHSHPHITVWPSHVDVRTQADYQMLDDSFVGIIFSVFNHEKATKMNKIQVTCFQSCNISPEGQAPQYQRMEVPLHIMPTDSISRPNLQCLTRLPSIIATEETDQYEKSNRHKGMDLLSKLHNAAVYSKSVCHILDILCGPLLQSLETRLVNNRRQIAELRREKERLLGRLEASPGKMTPV